MRIESISRRSWQLMTTLLGIVALVGAPACSVAQDDGDEDLESASDLQDDLTQGVTTSGLWKTKKVGYCFEHPLLKDMPSSVLAKVKTQAALDTRWNKRKQEFIGAINVTWQAVGVLNLVPGFGCGTSQSFVIRYNKNEPSGGGASGYGPGNYVSMDSEFLGDTYVSGTNTYHTFTAAHEMGHILGFRHEQDRNDSTCHNSQVLTGTAIKLSAYDPNSIMNYCNQQKTQLTALDKSGFKKAYSFL